MGALLVVGVLLGAACGDDDGGGGQASPTSNATTSSVGSAAASTTSAPAEAERCTADRVGGTVSFGELAPVAGLDPTVAFGSGSQGSIQLTALYDTLMRYDVETGEYVPHVAQSLTPNADLTEWTLKLRSGVLFGNGDALTADAVKFSVERMQKSRVSSSALANQIASVQVVDPLTVQFKLTGPMGRFAYLMAEETGMVVNPKVVNTMAPEDFSKNPVGAGVGPYEVERFAPGEEIVMRAKSNYWGGPVCIQSLRFRTVPGGQATYDAFRKGELQMAFISEPRVVADARRDGAEAYSQAIGGTGILLNAGIRGSAPPTKDVRVRRAITAAIDPEVVNQRVQQGTGLATSAVTWKDSMVYSGVAGPKYDPDLAKRLVAEVKAGGWDGRLQLLCGNTPQGVELGITISALLTTVGIQVTVESLATQDLVQRVITQANYETTCWGLNFIDANPWATGMSQFASTATNNRTGYAEPAMDTALTTLKAAVSTDEVKTALGGIQRVWNDTVPAALYAANTEFIAASEDVHGLVFTRDTTPMFHQAYLTS